MQLYYPFDWRVAKINVNVFKHTEYIWINLKLIIEGFFFLIMACYTVTAMSCWRYDNEKCKCWPFYMSSDFMVLSNFYYINFICYVIKDKKKLTIHSDYKHTLGIWSCVAAKLLLVSSSSLVPLKMSWVFMSWLYIILCFCRNRYDNLLERFNQLLLQKNTVQQEDSDPKAEVCERCLKMIKLRLVICRL